MYQALYRKWRPKVFADVIGQDHITRTLRTQVAEGRTSHAYLFTGTRGTGKTTCAKILAKAVNCENPQNGDPCCACPSCLGIENGSFLDVLELDAASNNGVDQVRALRDEAVYAPASVKKRVYIIDEVHMLTAAAFNALLKILEEPPEHLMFILATTELHKVLPTILSRCQRYAFKRILPRDIAARLNYVAARESIDLTPDGAELLSRLADGALRDGLSLLDQCAAAGGRIDSGAVLDVLGLAGNLQTAELLEHILRRDAQQALLLLGRLYDNGKDVGAILGELSTLVRDLLLRRTAPEGGAALLSGGYDSATLERLGKGLTSRRLLYMASTLQKAGADLSYSTNRRTDAELCVLRLCDESLSGDLSAVVSRVERLEERLERGAFVPVGTPGPAKSGALSADRKAGGSSPPAPEAAEESAPPPWDDADAPPESADSPPWEAAQEMAPQPPRPREPLRQQEPIRPAQARSVPPATESPPPAIRPSPAPERASAAAGDWSSLVERCKARLPGLYRAVLEQCDGVLADGTLTVYAPDKITLGRLDNDRVRTTLSEESGMQVILREGTPPAASPEENLKELLEFSSKYDNIKITGRP